MNFKELQKFVDHWRRGSCMEQRMGYLYGYYSEDPNYPLGVRINVEAIYEPLRSVRWKATSNWMTRVYTKWT